MVLNAATSSIAAAEQEDPASFDDVMRVNVGAQAEDWRAPLLRAMIGAAAGGWMILMSSILGRKAGTGPGVAAYAASKIAVEKNRASGASGHAGIRVNAHGGHNRRMNAPMTADPGRREALLARLERGCRPTSPGWRSSLAGGSPSPARCCRSMAACRSGEG